MVLVTLSVAARAEQVSLLPPPSLSLSLCVCVCVCVCSSSPSAEKKCLLLYATADMLTVTLLPTATLQDGERMNTAHQQWWSVVSTALLVAHTHQEYHSVCVHSPPPTHTHNAAPPAARVYTRTHKRYLTYQCVCVHGAYTCTHTWQYRRITSKCYVRPTCIATLATHVNMVVPARVHS